MHNIAILGASGYTGAELIRLLLAHPQVRIAALAAETQADKPWLEVYPHLSTATLPPLTALHAIDFSGIDTAFCCLPHGTSQDIIRALPAHLTIIDLSADFRLRDTQAYAHWYGHAHRAEALQEEAVYGLTEHARAALKSARLIANPGCYPTSALLPLIPLLREKLIAPDTITIDAKSGVTGAGRSAKQANLFTEIDGGMRAYGIGQHRHTPEIEQELSAAAGSAINITFTPHLIPMKRGILSSIYVDGDAQRLRACLQDAYTNEPFVHIMPQGHAPSTHEVRATNHCRIGVFGLRPGKALLVSVIDNLVKGASGQAVQNFNVKMHLPETLGLEAVAVFP